MKDIYRETVADTAESEDASTDTDSRDTMARTLGNISCLEAGELRSKPPLFIAEDWEPCRIHLQASFLLLPVSGTFRSNPKL